MHIQIANRLDYYTVNKSFPQISPYSHQIIQPLTAAVVPTIDIYDYDDFQQMLNNNVRRRSVMDLSTVLQ